MWAFQWCHMNSQLEISETAVDLGTNRPATRDYKGNSVNMVAGEGSKKFLVCAVGVFISYFYYGILQETM